MTRLPGAAPAALPERLRGLIAGFGVQIILFLLWVGVLILLYRGVVAPALGGTSYLVRASLAWLLPGVYGDLPTLVAHAPAASLSVQVLVVVVLCACALPKVLTFCVSLALLQRGMDRVRYDFIPGTPPGDQEDPRWDQELTHVLMEWEFEQRRTHEGIERVLQYGGFFGFVASAVLSTCVLIMNGHEGELMTLPRCAIALVVAAATATSFIVNLGRILVRVAHRDASPRMFAWATRALLLVVAGAVLAGLVLLPPRAADNATALLSTALGAVLLGVGVALFGERALQLLTDRAAQLIGLPASRPPAALELSRVSGLSDSDSERLAEEGIDSLHALAYCTTARLYFNTTYSLERICDWQDQALLLASSGPKASLLREQFLVSGASQAQALAERLLRLPAAPPPPPEVPPCGAADASPAAPAGAVPQPPEPEPLPIALRLDGAGLGREDRGMIVKLLGFATAAQAQVALQVLADDQRARRLRVYRAGGVRRL